jgi:AcrR family transcriptional regulator
MIGEGDSAGGGSGMPNGARDGARSRAAVLAAAAELFAHRGYRDVTIRDIAVHAELSPSMVMKCGGSKRQLFIESATITPSPLPDVPVAELGTALVRQLLERMSTGDFEPLNRALVLRVTAPDPSSVRDQFVRGYLQPLTDRLGGDRDAALRAELAVAALMGLGASLRIFEVPTSRSATGEVERRYGATVQALFTG